MRSPFRAFLVASAVVTFVGCGGSSTAPSGSSSGGLAPVVISIVGDRGNLSFSPNPATAGGRMVVFRNNDSVAHRVRLNDLTVDWGTIQPGATSAPLTMPAAGTNYHCSVHPTMIGAVAAEGQPPPACRGDYC